MNAVMLAAFVVAILASVILGVDYVNGGIGDCADDLFWLGSCP